MQTVTLASAITAVARGLGWNPDSDDGITAEQRARIVGWINERMRECWEWAFWPALMLREERDVLTDATTGEYYILLETPAWSAATTYAVGDKVQYLEKFYKALLAGSNKNPVTETTYWEALTQTPMGTVAMASTNSPLTTEYPEKWPFVPGDGKIVLSSTSTPSAVWVEFRRVFRDYGSEEFELGTIYAAGDVVYWVSTGESYRCVWATDGTAEPSDATYWEKQDFPAFLRGAVVDLAVSDGIVEADREDQAEKREEKGYTKLANLEPMNGLQTRAEYEGYP